MFRGVITGCSAKEEAFLPRWWEHFSKYNTCPVTFVDFGMSKEALTFCKAHGNLIQSPTKHSALSASPYQETIWTDIHCEIQENLSPLFEMARCQAGFAIVKDQTYQTEVFSFLKTSPILSEWPKWIDQLGEVEALSHLLEKKKYDITFLSTKFNWDAALGKNPQAIILTKRSAA